MPPPKRLPDLAPLPNREPNTCERLSSSDLPAPPAAPAPPKRPPTIPPTIPPIGPGTTEAATFKMSPNIVLSPFQSRSALFFLHLADVRNDYRVMRRQVAHSR